MQSRKKNKCTYCELPVYCKDLCRRHYKKYLNIKNGTYKKEWERKKQNPKFLERKRLIDKLYREKKKAGISTKRKTNDSALINRDWKEYYKQWVKNSSQYKLFRIKRNVKHFKNKLRVIDHYSGGKNCCQRCGFNDIRALQIDHVNNDGGLHRKMIGSLSPISWIIKNNFPNGFQILCANCNFIKEAERRDVDFEKRNDLNL